MSFSKLAALSGAISFASKVAAHGTVTGIKADGVYYEGYHANYQYLQTQPVVVGWSTPLDLGNGFIAPDAYNSSDIICWTGATNAQTSATVAAGGTVELQWTAWPSSHHGPVIDYLASCKGDCKTVDKTALEFFKIDGVGLLDDTTVPGNWATDTLIANNNSWAVTIPTDIAPGNYVLRHEIIALHSAGTADGAQNYPQCFNLEVTGSGTATPSGTLGTALYNEDDAGILVNIYSSLSTYEVPGPTLYSGAVSMSQTLAASATSVAPVGTAASSTAAVTTDASSAPVATSVAATSVASSPSSGITSAAAIQASGPPFANGTASASKKSKSACKPKSSKSGSIPALSSITQHAKVTTTSETTFASSVTIPTSSSEPTSVPGSSNTGSSSGNTGSETTPETTPSTTFSTPPETTTAATEVPSGTTLSTLLSWLSSFYTKHAGTEYTGSTVARRAHARDVARREDFEKFDGVNFKPTGTHGGFPHGTGFPHHTHSHGTGAGFAQPTGFPGFGNAKFAAQGTGAAHHHSHGHGTGAAKPTGFAGFGRAVAHGTGAAHHHYHGHGTGVAPGGAKPTGFAGFGRAEAHGTGAPHHHGHGHGTGVAGGAKPTGVFPAGGAFPTGSGKFRIGGF